MTEAKPTPRPWMAAAKPSSIVGWPIVAQPHGRLICNMAYVPASAARSNAPDVKAFYAEAEANAHLIAASPDMAAFITAFLGLVDSRPYVDWDWWRPLIDQARAAKAKAEGLS